MTLPSETAAELSRITATGGLAPVFQPVVNIADATVIGYEALIRGPVGPLEYPTELFAAARAAGQVPQLDAACRNAVLRAATAVGIAGPSVLFVNMDQSTLIESGAADWEAVAAAAVDGPQLVLDISEDTLVASPIRVVAVAERLRAAGFRIALENLGAHDLSLALLPLLRPDVIKLDLRLTLRRPPESLVVLMNAVSAYADRTGSPVLATGIETEQQLEMARTLGATLGQGWLLQPAFDPAAADHPDARAGPLLPPAPTAAADSPFDCLPAGARLRVGRKSMLMVVSRQLEAEASNIGNTCVVLATFQHARHFTAATAARFHDLADRVGLVVALGESAADDPLRRQWALTVLSPHFAGALLARDLEVPGPDRDRMFEFAVTYDRDAVEAAARHLMGRIGVDAERNPAQLSVTVPAPVGGETRWRGVSRVSRFDSAGRLFSYLGTKDLPATPVGAAVAGSGQRLRDRGHADLQDLADHDPLTGLLNRRSLPRIWAFSVAHALATAAGVVLLYLDLDGMKGVNDRWGHAVGDAVLTATADRLLHRVRVDDRVARVGGDEFIVILSSGVELRSTAEIGHRVAEHLRADLAAPIATQLGDVTVTVSIGVSSYPHDGDSFDQLLHIADRRMYTAKRRSRQPGSARTVGIDTEPFPIPVL